MQGLHLTADLRGCAAARPRDDRCRRRCDRPASTAVAAAGLTPVGELFHRFAAGAAQRRGAPAGITGVVLLAESHLAVHTWPEIEAATLDVYVCNFGADNSARAEALLAALIAAFAPAAVERHALERGVERGARPLAAMKAIVLAAGRGKRMRPLSDTRPSRCSKCAASR